MVAFDIEINRGDLRRLAPRKKLLKAVRVLANRSALFGFLLSASQPFDRCTKSKGNCDD
jgi:hypothetical protein